MSHFQEFTQYVKNASLSRANRYLVEITGPSKATLGDGLSNQNLSFMCDFVSVPGLNLSTKDAGLYGVNVMRPDGGIEYENIIPMSFLLDQDQKVKKYFDDWMKLIVDPDSFLVSYQEDYLANVIKIHQLDMADQITYTTELYDAYPTQMGNIEYAAQATNQFGRLPMRFTFKNWKGFSANSQEDRINESNKYTSRVTDNFIINEE